ncbi:hypothetical protein ACERJO_11875 [Halalkalibacter sp. AB-rgal2]|uniref:hypothetical protein n=1 Tax=Halalkalibacter sp. AB-rgal2 TaxID=3242695 RepID=UPI00359CC68C
MWLILTAIILIFIVGFISMKKEQKKANSILEETLSDFKQTIQNKKELQKLNSEILRTQKEIVHSIKEIGEKINT